MTDNVIEISNLGKKYKIGSNRVSDANLVTSILSGFRNSATRLLKLLTGRLDNASNLDREFWALRHLSLNIAHGEVVGFIGRNGAGKSTLLKLLSSITEPTEGRIQLIGRVGSLLEVGTGFHSELTGRENVYLNGTILGMSHAEVKRKFDQIVDFAGIEQFIDTPVKHYSSGMAVRLGFSVAAHLEPEILIIDEVLSVGDAEFQRKSIGKMSEVASEGRTVLFVSHNLAAVENLCTRGIVLEKGQVSFDGTQVAAIQYYIDSIDQSKIPLQNREDREGTGELQIYAIQFRNKEGKIVSSAITGEDVYIYLFYTIHRKVAVENLIVGIAVKSVLDTPIFLHHNQLTENIFRDQSDSGAFVLCLKNLPLAPSSYRITYSVQLDNRYVDRITNAAEFSVVARDFYKSGRIPPPSHGFILVDATWEQVPRISSDDTTAIENIYYE